MAAIRRGGAAAHQRMRWRRTGAPPAHTPSIVSTRVRADPGGEGVGDAEWAIHSASLARASRQRAGSGISRARSPRSLSPPPRCTACGRCRSRRYRAGTRAACRGYWRRGTRTCSVASVKRPRSLSTAIVIDGSTPYSPSRRDFDTRSHRRIPRSARAWLCPGPVLLRGCLQPQSTARSVQGSWHRGLRTISRLVGLIVKSGWPALLASRRR